MNKRGAVAIFVIVALVIVGAIVLFFVFRSNFNAESIPAEFLPIYNLYSQCVNEQAELGISLLGSQGGRIDIGNYVPGSDYAPFSSHLNFLGTAVPYWYHITGNGIAIQNVPTRTEMERELGQFIDERINDNCNFDQYYQQGFYIDLGEPNARVIINPESVTVNVEADVATTRGESSARKTQHEVIINSKVGSFYEDAKKIYEKEMSEGFLEDYSVDVLRLYAPVDGVEIQCNPKIWETQSVAEELHTGLEANIAKIKFQGDYYRLDSKEDEYFVVDVEVNDPVQLIYSKSWPSKVEITPANEAFMIAEPIGNQQGLGVMGFCYVPYHFIYDVSYAVMVQVSDGTEFFQFPLVVVLDNNQPKQASPISIVEDEEVEFDACEFASGEIEVNTFDVNLNPIEAEIEYQCLTSSCNLGKTILSGSSATLVSGAPACLNGYIVANAEGFAEKRQLFSSNTESVVDVVMDREYELNLDLLVGSRTLKDGETAIVYFEDENANTETAIWPEDTKVKLKEGSYIVRAYIYGNSDIVIPKSTREQCQQVLKGGISGLFGAKEEVCYDFEIPETKLDHALIGGGSQEIYIFEDELINGGVLVETSEFPNPSSLEQLQYNYANFENENLEVTFT